MLQVPLADFYFLPSKIMVSGGIDNILRQMNQQNAQEVDTFASAGVRNFLFGERNSGGADLVASNIQRGTRLFSHTGHFIHTHTRAHTHKYTHLLAHTHTHTHIYQVATTAFPITTLFVNNSALNV
jgi:hypothetical protein